MITLPVPWKGAGGVMFCWIIVVMDRESLQPPEKMFDGASGTVTLRLVPFYLTRIHGEWPSSEHDAESLKPPGLPFPLLPGAELVDLIIQGNLTPKDLGAGQLLEPNSSLGTQSWWRWHAYAMTAFGWASWPTPFFRKDRLFHLQLNRGSSDDAANFDEMKRAVIKDLGEPHEEGERKGSLLSGLFFRPPSYATRYAKWKFPWGHIEIGYEPRDWSAVLGITWDI